MNSEAINPGNSTKQSLRKRILENKMGPPKEENQNDIIEMEESVKPTNFNEEDWNHNEETDESETMLLNNLNKLVADPEEEEESEESFWLITFQVFFPFLIAGLGMVGAGLVLDIVQVSRFSLYFLRILE